MIEILEETIGLWARYGKTVVSISLPMNVFVVVRNELEQMYMFKDHPVSSFKFQTALKYRGVAIHMGHEAMLVEMVPSGARWLTSDQPDDKMESAHGGSA